jgi:LAGLIDADG DNA endonuclease family protein
MRTPKINALHRLIDFLNNSNRVNTPFADLPLLPLDTSPIDSNAWLSGFLDADGHFHLRYTPAGKYTTRVEWKLEIEQRIFDVSGESIFDILSLLAEFVLGKVKVTKPNSPNPKFRVRTTSMLGNQRVGGYLDLFPLFSTKHLDYLVWREGVIYMLDFRHFLPGGKEYFLVLKASMNSNRTQFAWSHLDKFYHRY